MERFDPDKDQSYQPLRTRLIILCNMSIHFDKKLFPPDNINNDPAVRHAYYQMFYCKDTDTYDEHYEKDFDKFTYNACHNKRLSEWPSEVLISLARDIEENAYLQEQFHNQTKFNADLLKPLQKSFEKINQRINELMKTLNGLCYISLAAIVYYIMFIYHIV